MISLQKKHESRLRENRLRSLIFFTQLVKLGWHPPTSRSNIFKLSICIHIIYIVTPKDANQVSFVTLIKIIFYHILSFWVSAVQQKLLFSRHRFNQNQLTMLLVGKESLRGRWRISYHNCPYHTGRASSLAHSTTRGHVAIARRTSDLKIWRLSTSKDLTSPNWNLRKHRDLSNHIWCGLLLQPTLEFWVQFGTGWSGVTWVCCPIPILIEFTLPILDTLQKINFFAG